MDFLKSLTDTELTGLLDLLDLYTDSEIRELVRNERKERAE